MEERIKPLGKDIPYDLHWALTVKDKVVLDIGADIGSTADYFLRMGAKQVIAVEGHKDLYAALEENAKKIPQIKAVYKLIGCYGGFEELIKEYRPDVAKIDCEGMELHMISMDDAILRLVKSYMIEIHSPIIFGYLLLKFIYNGFKIEIPLLNPIIIHAQQ